MEMAEQGLKLIQACVVVLAALGYCYALPLWTRAGGWHLLAVLPVLVLFSVLPFSFASIQLRGISAFFLTWLAVFKLLLFSLGRGPLSPSSSAPPSSFSTFLAVAAFPIKLRREQQPPPARGAPRPLLTLMSFAAKGFLLSLIISLYPQRRRFHRGLVLSLYSVHIYLSLEVILTAAAAVCRLLLPKGTELAPQFAAPYLSSSLQDFWGRRWNLMVSDILRSSVYDPVRSALGSTAGVMASFLVSGLMHELMFYYLTLKPPTGEVGCFFVLHGACVVAEIAAKRWWARQGMERTLPLAVAAPLTIGFLAATVMWLFFPQITRGGVEELMVSEVEAVARTLHRAVRWV